MLTRLLLVAAALFVAGCARTINLLNPFSPRFQGAFAAPAAGRTDSPANLRVVTFNIKLADRIGAAIHVLRDSMLRDADIISLQEMDETGTDRIARALRVNYVYYPSSIHPTRGRYFGPALLTRWPIEKSWKVLLPHEGPLRRQRRSATAALVNVRGTRIRVYAVHLETQFRSPMYHRTEQAAAILADAVAETGPVIVAGDFNGWGVARQFEQNGFAWPTKNVGRTIRIFSWDHIFVRGIRLRGSAAGKVNEVRGASDHRPVWASLVLSEPPAIITSDRSK